MFCYSIDSPENPLALLGTAYSPSYPTVYGNMSDSSLSDSDSENFYTPPSSLGVREEDINVHSKEGIMSLNKMLKEAIRSQDKEGVLKALTPLNKWIVTWEIWCRENEVCFFNIDNSRYVQLFSSMYLMVSRHT